MLHSLPFSFLVLLYFPSTAVCGGSRFCTSKCFSIDKVGLQPFGLDMICLDFSIVRLALQYNVSTRKQKFILLLSGFVETNYGSMQELVNFESSCLFRKSPI